MNSPKSVELLFLYAKLKKPFEISVFGSSMNPILHNGDTITVCRKEEYATGDVLVFLYKNSELLVHRLLKIENGRYFCKGDNSFRLEDIISEQILGAVMLERDRNHNAAFIAASLGISRIFRRCGYNAEAVKATSDYIAYKENYLENADEVHQEQ